ASGWVLPATPTGSGSRLSPFVSRHSHRRTPSSGNETGHPTDHDEGGSAMTLGYDKSLYVLAFDHRGSFQKKFFGVTGVPNAEEAARIADAKQVIFEGALKALGEGAPREEAGILVDEQFGADIVRKPKADGLTFAMPVEKSGQEEFDFEYGDGFGEHITEFDPSVS